MKIGVIKEIKSGENRVGMTPHNVSELVKAGHTVLFQEDAGIGAGFSNEEYIKAGGIISTQDETWDVELFLTQFW